MGLYAFPCARASKLNQQICMYVCMYVWLYVCMYVCNYVWLYVCMYVCMYVCIQWHEANVLDNWQLAELSQSGGREFDPRRVRDNLSVPLLGLYAFSCARASTLKPTYMYICIRMFACFCLYMHAFTHACAPAYALTAGHGWGICCYLEVNWYSLQTYLHIFWTAKYSVGRE